MHEIHLKQPGFTYSDCRPFTKNKERIQKFKETGDTKYIYKNELDKACFQHGMAYGGFKDLAKRAPFGKVLTDKSFNIAKNPKFNGYKRGTASMVYKFLYGINMHVSKSAFNKEKVAEELHKPIIKKIKKRTVYSGFKDNIWGDDLANMQLISKFNKRFRFLLCVIDIFCKYALVFPLKDEKSVRILNAFQKNIK